MFYKYFTASYSLCNMVGNELVYVIIKRLPITIPMRTMPKSCLWIITVQTTKGKFLNNSSKSKEKSFTISNLYSSKMLIGIFEDYLAYR